MDITEKIIAKKKINIPDKLNSSELRKLILRVCKKQCYADKLEFIQCEPKNGFDCYSIYDKDNKIVIEAANTISAAVAFNYYLTEVCHSYFGPVTKNINLPEIPPDIGKKHSEKSRFLYRYFMNYCTFSYTMLFAGYDEYERLTDWMLLSGVNLMLNIVGHEIVVRDMLLELGYSKLEVQKYISGPAYLPWQWMGNMTGFGGPLPDWWYEKQKKLANGINKKMSDFGAAVIMPGFFGMVPQNFGEKFKGSKPVSQGVWCRAFEQPSILADTDEMFDRVADIFYKKTKEHFGDISYFSGDPFHEGGNTEGIDLCNFGKKLVSKMKQHNKNGVWILQGWQNNPEFDLYRGMEKEDIIIAFLSADRFCTETEGFNQYPWLYISTPNFGGNRIIDGNINGFLSEPFEINEKHKERLLIGTGMAMEAVEMDEPVFDAFSRISVKSEPIKADDFIKSTLMSRYGFVNDNLLKTFKMMLDNIYTLTEKHLFSGKESVLCARPQLDVKNVTYWAFSVEGYTLDMLLLITKNLLKEYESLKENECYLLDLADFARQLLAEYSRGIAEKFSTAFKNGNRSDFEDNAAKFLDLAELDNTLMSAFSKTRLSAWVKRAENYSETEEDKKMLRFNAKNLLLLWASREGSDELHDYAYREWGGLLEHYKHRWELFFEEARKNFGKQDFTDSIDWTTVDYEFTASGEEVYDENAEPINETVSRIIDEI